MRDLYKHLGISCQSTEEEIRRAIIRNSSGDVKHDAEEVLLGSGSRAVYDRNRALLLQIGTVRKRLGVENSRHWTGSTAEDFTPVSIDKCSPLAELKSERARKASVERPRREPSATTPTREGTHKSWLIRLVVLAVIAAGVYLNNRNTQSSREQATSHGSRQSTNSTPPIPIGSAVGPTRLGQVHTPSPTPAFAHPAKPLPQSGTFWAGSSARRQAPFKITTPRDGFYYAKLVDYRTGREVIAIFVDGGDSVEVEVPLGTFELRYASGRVWYGREFLFGPDTQYAKGETPLSFSIVGNYASGNQVTLYKVANGNFETSPITAAEF
jgi:hypothetical protein